MPQQDIHHVQKSRSSTPRVKGNSKQADGSMSSPARSPSDHGRSPSSHSNSNNDNSEGRQDERPRLSAAEKKKNHIASEQKRRQAIRDEFDRLSTIVPGAQGQARSESIVLHKAVNYIRETTDARNKLIQSLLERGAPLPDHLRDIRILDPPDLDA